VPVTARRSYVKMQIRSLPNGAGRSASFNESDKTFQFVLATETPALRVETDADGNAVVYSEVLSIDGIQNFGEIVGKSLLDSHNYTTVNAILGKIVAADLVNNELVCTAQLSDAPSVYDIACKVSDGSISSVSVGYSILASEDSGKTDDTGRKIIIVTAWTAEEASLVAVPADTNAKIRSKSKSGEKKMAVTSKTSKRAKRDTTQSDQTDENGADGEDDDEDDSMDEKSKKSKRAKRDADDEDDMSDDESDAERSKRAADVKALRSVAIKNGVEAEFDVFARTGASITELRSLTFNAMTRSSSQKSGGFREAPADRKTRSEAPQLISFKETAAAKRAASYRVQH